MRYLVEVLDDQSFPEGRELGSVLLPPGCDAEQVEGALVALGVYAPRGWDVLEWLDEEVATIRSADGELMVRLFGVPAVRATGVGR